MDCMSYPACTLLGQSSDVVAAAEEVSILQWLSTTIFFDKREILRKNLKESNPESGLWFLESDRFADWLFFPQSFLWLYGECKCSLIMFHASILLTKYDCAAGSGKSCLWYTPSPPGSHFTEI